MKRRAGLLLVIGTLACAGAAPAAAAPGALDGSLAGAGWVRTLEVRDGTGNYLPAGAEAVAVQPDGKIVTAGGLIDARSGRYFGAFRFLPDGRLDPTFGRGGWSAVDLGSFEEVRAVAVQGDGKIVVAGDSSCTTGRCITAVRFDPDGSVDAGFGAGGVVRKEFYLEPSRVSDVAVDRDGRIVLAGSRSRGGSGQDSELVCVVRLLPDGRLDTSFSRDGVAVLDHGYGNDSAESVGLQGRRIVVAGDGRHTGTGGMGVARFRRDGRLDRSFGRGGHRIVSFGSRRLASAHSLAVTPGGRVVVAGSAVIEGDAPQFALASVTRNGALDRRFGSRGRVRTSPGPLGGRGLAVAAASGGRILVAGLAFTDAVFDGSDWALARYSRGGGLDRTFGAGGVAVAHFSTGSDEAAALAVVPGRAVAAGAIGSSLGIARFLTD